MMLAASEGLVSCRHRQQQLHTILPTLWTVGAEMAVLLTAEHIKSGSGRMLRRTTQVRPTLGWHCQPWLQSCTTTVQRAT
jgi:hypothetical protein